MRSVEFMGLQLYPKPSYEAVLDVEEVVQKWILSKIPISQLNMQAEFEAAIWEYAGKNPEFLAELTIFKERIEDVRLVMLVANKTREEVQRIQRNMEYGDFKALLKECKAVINAESVDDFLKKLRSDTSTPPDETAQET